MTRTLQMLCLLAALLSAAPQAQAVHDSRFCTLTTKNDQTGVPTLDKRFYVAVTAQFTDKGKTNDLYEYFDEEKQRGSIFWQAQNMNKQITFDYRTQQAFTVDLYKRPDDNKACVVSPLKDFKDAQLGGGVTDKYGRILAPSAAGVFNMGANEKKEFKGKTVVRGINANRWYACTYSEKDDLSMKINYYFSDPSAWTLSGQNAKVAPVRVSVEGMFNGKKRSFNHIYDITHYRTGFKDSEYPFQVPTGYYCKGIFSNKTLPWTPSAFSYTAEVIDRYRATITNIKERYNFQANLSRTDFSTVPGEPDQQNFGTGRLSKLYDFSRGIEYVKNHDIGNCSVRMLERGDSDSTKDGRLVNPNQFFKLDDSKSLHYKGQQTVRGRTVDVYIVRRKGDSFPMADTSYEWGFDLEYGAVQTFAKPVWMTQIVYRTSVWPGSMFSYNYYDYSSAVPDFWDIDLSMCFQTSDQKHYTVHITLLPKNVEALISYAIPNFKTQFAMAVGKKIEVSVIRITDIEIIQDDKGILVEFTLHERPPNAAGEKSGSTLELADALLVFNIKKGVKLDFVTGSDTFEVVKIDADSLVELQQRPKYITDVGYTSGEMSAVGFVLLILAIVMGAVVGFIFWMKPATPA